MSLRDELEEEVRKATSDAVVKESRFRIQDVALRRQQGAITTQEFYATMQREVKLNVAAQMADARGGWDKMRPQDWQRAEQLALRQWEGVGYAPWKEAGEFPGLRRFAEDTHAGRYNLGADGGELRQSFLNRAAMYPDSGRAIYENERLVMHKEERYRRGKRIRAAGDGCPTCIAEDGVERDIDDIVAIGNSECGPSGCNCTIIYLRN